MNIDYATANKASYSFKNLAVFESRRRVLEHTLTNNHDENKISTVVNVLPRKMSVMDFMESRSGEGSKLNKIANFSPHFRTKTVRKQYPLRPHIPI